MIIFRKIRPLRNYLRRLENTGKMGFVPTMGALHEGHVSLIRTSLAENEKTLCSIFINPTQFNDPQDFQKYPVTLEEDIRKLESAGCDLLFLPDPGEIYPNGMEQQPHYDLGTLETKLEGQFRPGHFQGVCWVVDLLLRITEPDRLYLGQKDYQQCMVIARMIELKSIEVEIRICDTVREPDGLAMSSRNLRLDPAERARATALFRSLSYAREHLKPGSVNDIKHEGLNILTSEGLRADYFEIARADTLDLIEVWNGTDPVVALVAAFLGPVRLIDNIILNNN
jgi:pantoate--beta-alanine ligase